jgi:hypothetical protein
LPSNLLSTIFFSICRPICFLTTSTLISIFHIYLVLLPPYSVSFISLLIPTSLSFFVAIHSTHHSVAYFSFCPERGVTSLTTLRRTHFRVMH